MGLLLFLRRGVPARSAPGRRALLPPVLDGAAAMHDAFEHVPILEKLPLQIDCLAAWGEPPELRSRIPALLGSPPSSSSVALGAAGCELPGCGASAVRARSSAASALRAVP